MYGSKHIANVSLFPLCDARGTLIDALCDTAHAPATRGDALVFAWRLELPEFMNVADAANALLVVAMNVPRQAWTRQQLLIIRELMVLAGREGSLPAPVPRQSGSSSGQLRRKKRASEKAQGGLLKVAPAMQRSTAMVRDGVPADRLRPAHTTRQAKESKQWWKLVGKQEEGVSGQPTSRSPRDVQRKTRKERVSREP